MQSCFSSFTFSNGEAGDNCSSEQTYMLPVRQFFLFLKNINGQVIRYYSQAAEIMITFLTFIARIQYLY